MSFWSDFSGKSQQKDLRNANQQSEEALRQGYTSARTDYDRAYADYAPYVVAGRQGAADNDIYRQAIGLGTPDQQGAAQDRYFNDPALERAMQPQFNAMQRYLNARGAGGGGKAQLASARVANEGYQGWLDRVGNVGQNAMATGLNAAQGRSGVAMNRGDLAYGYGATKAGNAVNYGNAMAQSRGILSNNLLGLAGTAAKAYAGRPGASA